MAQRKRNIEDETQDEDSSSKEDSGHGLRALGLGLITGAADDDCSAIGTYASAGAKFGPGLLWTAPVTLPMMFTVVYPSSKLGQVSGRGLFRADQHRKVMGKQVNSGGMNVLGWVTTPAIFAATAGLVATWII